MATIDWSVVVNAGVLVLVSVVGIWGNVMLAGRARRDKRSMAVDERRLLATEDLWRTLGSMSVDEGGRAAGPHSARARHDFVQNIQLFLSSEKSLYMSKEVEVLLRRIVDSDGLSGSELQDLVSGLREVVRRSAE